MPRTTPKRQSPQPAPVRVDGVVFHVALHEGRWAETIGDAFEYRGRTWAVHRSTMSDPSMPALFSVSDVKTGRRVGQIMEASIVAARTVAIEIIDRTTPEQWEALFPPARASKSRARSAVV